MKLLFLFGLVAFWVLMARVSIPIIREVLRLREDKRYYSKNFNAGQLDQVEILLSHRISSLSFIVFTSLAITLVVIFLIFLGDLSLTTF
jgi:hypothetical protein